MEKKLKYDVFCPSLMETRVARCTPDDLHRVNNDALRTSTVVRSYAYDVF